eukprot:Polyplicarium_translucidae@DN1132_c0_g1_i1.p1
MEKKAKAVEREGGALPRRERKKEEKATAIFQREFGDATSDPLIAAKIGRNERMREDPQYMMHLRDESRRDYLRMRELEQLELARRVVADREALYRDLDLTSSESAALREQKESLAAATAIVGDRKEKSRIEAYEMPESYDDDTERRMAVVHRRYLDQHADEREKRFVSEHELWEQHQTASATAKFGAQSGVTAGPEYSLLGPDFKPIDFVAGEVTAELLPEGEEPEWMMSRAERDEKAKEKRQNRMQRLAEERRMLPIYNYRDTIIQTVRDNPVVIIVGETGSGKTTQIPQYLLEEGFTEGRVKKIGCTQPRRVAAMSVSARVAEELGCKLGHDVGYSIRFEDCTSDKTVIKYLTDGMLLREILGDPPLDDYSVIVIDEAHERTLHTDVLLGLVKDLARFRENFKLLVSSATLEAEKFSKYFDDAPILQIPGRKYPVKVYYTKTPEADFIEASILTILQTHLTQPLGDVLVFLPGQQEIDETQRELERRTRGRGTEIGELVVLPIYANLPTDMQAKVFEPTPPRARKIVLATNIAETSITIDNIVYVIDPGFIKQNSYSPKTGLESLSVVPCSKASANQRAGRAGRVRPGVCFRLYTKWTFTHELEESNVPEIQRTNLGNVVLTLMFLGIEPWQIIDFDFMDPPPPEALKNALELLYALRSLDDKGELTEVGKKMAQFPLDPMFSKMIIQAGEFKCVDEVITICAMLGLGNTIFYRPKDKAIHADNARRNFNRPYGDHLSLLNVYRQWEDTEFSVNWCFENYIQARSMKRARDVREQLVELLDRVDIENSSATPDSDSIRRAITSGFFPNAARLNQSGGYTTVKHPHSVEIHPQSSLFIGDAEVDAAASAAERRRQERQVYRAPCVIYTELVLTTREFMRNVVEIKAEWLLELAPFYYGNTDAATDLMKMPKGMGTSRRTER